MVSEYEQVIIDNVDEHGWFSTFVFPDHGDEPAFTYSTGWWRSIHSPEAIIWGLGKKLQHSMLWELYRQIEEGFRLSDGCIISNLIEGFDCIARPVHPSHMDDYLLSALWYRKHETGSTAGLQAFQIFWPGKEQRLYPWEPGCDPSVRDWQPLLYLPKQTGLA